MEWLSASNQANIKIYKDCVATRRYTNNTNDSKSRNNKKPSNEYNSREKRAWILKIRDVKESDKGWYMCQINTDPMKSQVGYLDVVGE
ncbi:unnamed protein product [Ceratitis capitata]|uniref:(Mediterranean fruit fly) hypothetical protein n=1 Tax=Ceratitis capitata TaxID=7213 RepID=A0A811UN59_CERCA|nr:unnamed protein product [Ceratitis capitata]